MRTSKHYATDRQEREMIIQSIGLGNPVDRFIVDRGHRNGPEIHELTDTGIINVYNEWSGKLVTRLIARPGQIRRYYPNGKAPQNLIQKAIDNTVKNCYNMV